jgi:hypothetical protein
MGQMSQNSRTDPIDLPSSTALGIRALLCLIDSDRSIDWLIVALRSDHYDPATFAGLQDLYQIIDIYRFTGIYKKMAWKLGTEPFTLLALSAIAKQDHLFTRQTIVRDNLDPAHMPIASRRLLAEFAPEYLVRIHEQYHNRAMWWKTLELAFKVGEQIAGYDDFSLKCKKSGCENYKAHKKQWMRIRVQAAEAALQSLKTSDVQVTAQQAIEGVVKCPGCALRLHKVFTAALYKQHRRGWSWDLEEGESNSVSFW